MQVFQSNAIDIFPISIILKFTDKYVGHREYLSYWGFYNLYKSILTDNANSRRLKFSPYM